MALSDPYTVVGQYHDGFCRYMPTRPPESYQGDGDALTLEYLRRVTCIGVRSDGALIFTHAHGTSTGCRFRVLQDDGKVTTLPMPRSTPRVDLPFPEGICGGLAPNGADAYVDLGIYGVPYALYRVNLWTGLWYRVLQTLATSSRGFVAASKDFYVVVYAVGAFGPERTPLRRARLLVIPMKCDDGAAEARDVGGHPLSLRFPKCRDGVGRWASFVDVGAIAVNHQNGMFYFHDFGSCIRRLDPWTRQVKTVVNAVHDQPPQREELNQAHQSLVVARDGYVYFTRRQQEFDTGRFESSSRVYGADGSGECARVITKIRSVSTLALDDDRGILYVSTERGQIFAVQVPTSASRRRERHTRVSLLFQLCAAGRASFHEARLSHRMAVFRRFTRDLGEDRSDRCLRLLAQYSHQLPCLVSLILRFMDLNSPSFGHE